jgi:hypothetical protein
LHGGETTLARPYPNNSIDPAVTPEMPKISLSINTNIIDKVDASAGIDFGKNWHLGGVLPCKVGLRHRSNLDPLPKGH